ncbi:gliding motility-associated C-terminal domain-containing protein [Flavobacterium arcticum]|uniref:Gliding motility-associated C-terminal domain-containing protein n=1 Tax=Flavobacterium arcticum TaxID=1784713 RepID=A0A345H8X2_9FLAO|nr:gliding motility-associated C-terminal domain-containing protein [Flavobacterium arcticum]AXG73032.1 gliding motility-associated C-terminal domain-containing protein [Flavobacterium arcticum]KAF2510305.1 gliding motility-associated C-terminal domain-containing protein [Flavobacterium arcticum]
MINHLPINKTISVLILFFCTLLSYGQLPDFTLTVAPTPQTCLGNGTLTFTITGNDPAASIDYAVYLLPNTTTPVTIVTANTATGLSAGNYLVVATQSLGALSNTSSANVTIINQVIPLTYNLAVVKVKCGNDGEITVNVATGNAVSYEILTGPVTVPQQTSNVFNNLPIGLYTIRAYNNCGEAVVNTTQVIQENTGITINAPVFIGGELPDCNTITVGNTYEVSTSGNNIFWPLSFQYTVYPPSGGTPTIVTGTALGGSITAPNAKYTNIPFYHDQEYYYDLTITDACGNVFTRNNNIVDQKFQFNDQVNNFGCNDNSLTIEPSNFVGPITVEFVSFPDGFIPEDYNINHPDFNGSAVYFLDDNPVPEGSYTVTVNDACGRSYTADFDITPPELQPQVTVTAICGSDVGGVEIEINTRAITSVLITNAPVDYAGIIPDDVSDLVNMLGIFTMANLPLGDYTFEIIDSCGDEYTEDVAVEVTGGSPDITVLQRPGCEEDFGSIRLNAAGDFESVIITAGPAEYSDTYPVDMSENITGNGSFYMNSLPAGSYEFTTNDVCGIERIKMVNVEGYALQINEVEIIPYCGSFQLDIDHFSNGNYVQSFWLQRYDEATDTWGDPVTGSPYTSGLPNNTNADFININLDPDESPFYSTIGDFRIVKAFYTYANGSSVNSFCFSVIDTFTFTGAPVITDVFSFPCAGGLTEVAVAVEGVAPFTYKITSKDGEPFLIDNGDSNVFSSIEAAYYNFQVTDDCGNIVNSQFNINATDPITVSASGFCEGEESILTVQLFSFLNYEWYKGSDPDTILSTTNSLTFVDFDSAINSGTYYVSITTTTESSCMNQVLEYEVMPNVMPNAGEDVNSVLCNEANTINLTDYLTTPHDNDGVWEDIDASGALTGNILDTNGLTAGTYSFKYTVNGLCDLTDEATVTLTINDIPVAPVVTSVNAVCEGENIQFSITTPQAGVTYQWTGPDNFTATEANPLITSAGVMATGVYSVTAIANDCISPATTVNVTVNAIPDFEIQGETALCEGQSTIIGVAPQNFDIGDVTYEWYYENELLLDVNSSDIEIFEIGTYEVLVNNNGCETSEMVNITANTAGFIVELEAGCDDFEYIISISNIDEMNGSLFQWTGPNGYSYAGEEAVITNLEGGEYFITVTNPEGCSVSASIMIENTGCIIPRGISPNDDGYNQTFDLSNLDVRDLQIFNRYGLQVYEKQNYINEWYGQSDKGDLPTGTYFYVVTLSAGKRVTGWVYLQREIH